MLVASLHRKIGVRIIKTIKEKYCPKKIITFRVFRIFNKFPFPLLLMKKKKKPRKSSSSEFMLKEYERIHQLWIDENLQAERRVNFFLTIGSGTIGAVIVIFEFGDLQLLTYQAAIFGVLMVLLLFGITVLNRLNSRTVMIRALRNSIHEVQEYFANKDPEISDYLDRQRKVFYFPDSGRFVIRFFQKSFSGGRNDLMIYCIAFISVGIITLILHINISNVFVIIISAILTFFITTRLLRIYCNYMVKVLRPWAIYKFK